MYLSTIEAYWQGGEWGRTHFSGNLTMLQRLHKQYNVDFHFLKNLFLVGVQKGAEQTWKDWEVSVTKMHYSLFSDSQ